MTPTSSWALPGLTDGPTLSWDGQVAGPAYREGSLDSPWARGRGEVVNVLNSLVWLVVSAGHLSVLVERTGEDRRGGDYEGCAEHGEARGRLCLLAVSNTSGGQSSPAGKLYPHGDISQYVLQLAIIYCQHINIWSSLCCCTGCTRCPSSPRWTPQRWRACKQQLRSLTAPGLLLPCAVHEIPEVAVVRPLVQHRVPSHKTLITASSARNVDISTRHLPQLRARFGLDAAASRACRLELEWEVVHVSGDRGGVAAGQTEGVGVAPGVLVETPLATGQSRTLGTGGGTQGVPLPAGHLVTSLLQSPSPLTCQASIWPTSLALTDWHDCRNCQSTLHEACRGYLNRLTHKMNAKWFLGKYLTWKIPEKSTEILQRKPEMAWRTLSRLADSNSNWIGEKLARPPWLTHLLWNLLCSNINTYPYVNKSRHYMAIRISHQIIHFKEITTKRQYHLESSLTICQVFLHFIILLIMWKIPN